MTRPRGRQPDLPARLLDRRRRSPTSPAAASAWTSSRPTSRRSAARSTSRAASAAARRFRIKIPLTLAIIPALMVTCARRPLRDPAGQPARARPPRGRGRTKGIEQIHGAPVYRLRGNLLPLVYLDRELGRRSGRLDRKRDALYIVVLQAEDRQFGLIVSPPPPPLSNPQMQPTGRGGPALLPVRGFTRGPGSGSVHLCGRQV